MSFTPDDSEPEMILPEQVDPNQPDEKPEKEKKIKENQHYIRTHMTKYENKLWYRFLRSYRYHGSRFIRQKKQGDQYIVDFYCPKARLVIEVDGSEHYTASGQKYDIARSESIEKDNVLVVRYSNAQIWFNFENVCTDIMRLVNERMGRPPIF